MFLDGHLHTYEAQRDKALFSSTLTRGHIDGGIVISMTPHAIVFLPAWPQMVEGG
jgi:hypothetical protein